ncbi:MAG TPA: hypothetical protein PKC28_04290 [Bdellovibrionales bacterium]|nr:hypothetical protein [Bdellovibrionales bacterium]
MKPYAMRRYSIQFFDSYLIVSGALMNLLALAAAVNAWTNAWTAGPGPESQNPRARAELQDARSCTTHLKGKTLEKSLDLELKIGDGKQVRVKLDKQMSAGRTKNGAAIHVVYAAVGAKNIPPLVLLINSKQEIERCVTSMNYLAPGSREVDCLAAKGEYDGKDICTLAVNLPSDCVEMRGTIGDQGLCRVPSEGRILRAPASVKTKVCTKTQCHAERGETGEHI